jgi:hypothetical protein
MSRPIWSARRYTIRLASMGIGHWTADAGAGYSYLNEHAGFEGSIVAGLTYNFINAYTKYQGGVGARLDWADLAVPLGEIARRCGRLSL